MKLEVQLFARARDLAGAARIEIELPDSCTVADLRGQLVEQFPQLGPIVPSLLVAVGTDYADEQTSIKPSDEVACFPPVSGG